jgi:hypothetical protein
VKERGAWDAPEQNGLVRYWKTARKEKRWHKLQRKNVERKKRYEISHIELYKLEVMPGGGGEGDSGSGGGSSGAWVLGQLQRSFLCSHICLGLPNCLVC